LEHNDSEGAVRTHLPCLDDACGSSDARAEYADGHSFCFSCGKRFDVEGASQDTKRAPQVAGLLHGLEFPAGGLTARKLTEETCRRWGYRVGRHHGKPVQVAEYRDRDGNLVAQKVRYANKEFTFLGKPKEAGLFGQHLYGGKSKMLVITEGEIDAMSVSQVQNHKWPVVSIPNGAAGAKRDIMKQLTYLSNFEEIILMFDNDDAGRKAASDVAQALLPRKVRIASLPLKDANEMLKAGRAQEIIQAIWNATPYKPEGVHRARDRKSLVLKQPEMAKTKYPYECINTRTYGLHHGGLVMITGGTGSGKSAFAREIIYHLHHIEEEPVGWLSLEDPEKRSLDALVGIHMNKPIAINREGVSETDISNAFDELIGNAKHDLVMIDQIGSFEVEALLEKVEYLAKGEGCKWVVLDNITAAIAGLDADDERRLIDRLVIKLVELAVTLDIGIIAVCHLKRTDGKAHEGGAVTSLNQLRGSQSLSQFPQTVIGIERNQQAEEEDDRNTAIVRILKNRIGGWTGVAGELTYDYATGRLTEPNTLGPVKGGF
jgi:twinkle protein